MQTRFRTVAALVCGAITMGSGALWAQKPKSQKEVQAIQAVQAAQTPDDRIKAIENVLTNFADTEFKNVLLQMAMQAEQQKGDYAQTVFYAQRLLQADPKSAVALVTLATETASHTREFDLDKDDKLAKVDKWAKDGIEAAKGITAPRYPEEPKDLQAQGYEALGLAATLRKKYDDAANDFKQSVELATGPDAARYYVRLGRAYEDGGKFDDATDAFDKAANTPNVLPPVKSAAEQGKQDVAKRKSGGAAPAKP